MAIIKGMTADRAEEILGKPDATEVVGVEDKEYDKGIVVKGGLVVEWTYRRGIKLTLARRDRCYRVIKAEEGDF